MGIAAKNDALSEAAKIDALGVSERTQSASAMVALHRAATAPCSAFDPLLEVGKLREPCSERPEFVNARHDAPSTNNEEPCAKRLNHEDTMK